MLKGWQICSLLFRTTNVLGGAIPSLGNGMAAAELRLENTGQQNWELGIGRKEEGEEGSAGNAFFSGPQQTNHRPIKDVLIYVLASTGKTTR
jgi:hypothetical protein